jgi:hypothetical protein
MKARCSWCGCRFDIGARHGSDKRFCRSRCRKSFHSALHLWASISFDMGAVTIETLKDASAAAGSYGFDNPVEAKRARLAAVEPSRVLTPGKGRASCRPWRYRARRGRLIASFPEITASSASRQAHRRR